MSLKSIFKQVISKGMIKKAISIARYEGLGSLLTKVRSKCRGGREFSDAIDRNKDAKSPLVSIIIPVYNASKYTAECLESLYSVKNTTDFEVILIDNGSTDDTPDLIIEQSRLKDALYYFSQEKNLGFSGGVNLGIRHSKGKYIVILNNDTRVSNHWLDRLVAHAEQNPDVGIFSAITNYIGEGPQMAEDAKALGIDQINDYAASIAGRNLEIEPTRLVFFCVLIRRTLLDMIGLLDEDYIKAILRMMIIVCGLCSVAINSLSPKIVLFIIMVRSHFIKTEFHIPAIWKKTENASSKKCKDSRLPPGQPDD